MPYDFLQRPRRLRENSILREMLTENRILSSDLIMPVFVSEDIKEPMAIKSMPEIFKWPLDLIHKQISQWIELGIRSFAIFPCIPDAKKSLTGDEILNPDCVLYKTAKQIKSLDHAVFLMADLALDPYTSHGHDGIIGDEGRILNDETVEILARASVLAADSGYDFVAPSDMMDGRVIAIRNALDRAQHINTGIISYAAKFCSAYYGPFRDAIGSTQTTSIDKSSYQLNPSNSKDAIRELLLDTQEGADILIVKPAEPYLDIISLAKDKANIPIAAYQVSGEYSRIWAAASLGWLDLDSCAMESLLSIKRAGANLVITYFAERMARLLK